MADKIIIDGVDVSGCVYRDYKNNCCCDSTKPNEGEPRITGRGGCEYNPNCYYKQLKRKEQECEKKDKDIKYLLEKLDNSQKMNESCELHWEKERKELKSELQAEKDKVKELEHNLYLFKNAHDTEQGRRRKYEQALEEIKEIAQSGLKPVCYKSNCSKCRCYEGEDAKADLYALINCYFDENGEFTNENGDFGEELEGLLDNERSKCNKAEPICEQILQKCEVLEGE